MPAFREELVRAFPDVSALRELPELSSDEQQRRMSEFVAGWDASSVPKLHPLPWHIAIQRKISGPVRELKKGYDAVAEAVRVLLSERKTGDEFVLEGAGGPTSTGGGRDRGKPPDEYTGRQVTPDEGDDPYSADNRFRQEMSARLAQVQGDPSANSMFEAADTDIRSNGRPATWDEAYNRGSVIVINNPVFNDAVFQVPENRRSKTNTAWNIIIAIYMAYSSAVGTVDATFGVADRALEIVESSKEPETPPEVAPVTEVRPPKNEPPAAKPLNIADGFDGEPIDVVLVGTQGGLHIRDKPSVETGQWIGSFMNDDEGTVIDISNGWAKIRYYGEGGVITEGWITLDGNHLKER